MFVKSRLIFPRVLLGAEDATAARPESNTHDGFTMPFSVSIHPVEVDLGLLEPLYRRARVIYDLPEVPHGRAGCDDCKKLDNIMGLARKLQTSVGAILR